MKSPLISQRDFRTALLMCLSAGKMLHEYDLPKMLEGLEHAESAVVLFHPLNAKDAAEAHRRDKELLEAALPLYRLVVEREEESLARQAAGEMLVSA